MDPVMREEKPQQVTWENLIPAEHWRVYKCVLGRACRENLPFALGGGLALGVYTGRLRRSKDLDIYILPEHRDRCVQFMTECGLSDYYEKAPYDREWIYRGDHEGVIVDAIWAMANKRAFVDEPWLRNGPVVSLFGQEFRVIPPEELMWSKLYVLQRDRCDWPDILNLIYATGSQLDWHRLMERVAEDKPLLKGVLSVFSWVCPSRAAAIPSAVWQSLDLPEPVTERERYQPEGRPSPKDLLDSRPWFFTEPQYSAA